MHIITAAVLSFIMDLLFGDPEWMPHPVVYMGKAISRGEAWLRQHFPDDPHGRRRAGRVMAAGLPIVAFLVCGAAILLLYKIKPLLGFLLNVFWGWQALALRGLAAESTNVYRKLTGGTIEEARMAVSRIVGRDTQELTAAGVTKAAVETVAENFSDGVIAPLLYLLAGGAPLALRYKAVNTMDSMIGYKNEKYLDFGRAAAKLDDAANYIPARLSALLLVAAAFLGGFDAKHAAAVWKRDRRKHASPNSAQTESVMAGALGIRLAGPAYYFGEYYDKPYIGDDLRAPEPEDIRRANRMLFVGSVLGLLLLCGLRWWICRVLL